MPYMHKSFEIIQFCKYCLQVDLFILYCIISVLQVISFTLFEVCWSCLEVPRYNLASRRAAVIPATLPFLQNRLTFDKRVSLYMAFYLAEDQFAII